MMGAAALVGGAALGVLVGNTIREFGDGFGGCDSDQSGYSDGSFD